MTTERPSLPAATPASESPVTVIGLQEDEMANLRRVLPLTYASLMQLEASINRLVEFNNTLSPTHKRSEEGEL